MAGDAVVYCNTCGSSILLIAVLPFSSLVCPVLVGRRTTEALIDDLSLVAECFRAELLLGDYATDPFCAESR